MWESFKTLGVKEWFADRNNMVDYAIDAVIEVREKSVKVVMIWRGYAYYYWVPKSCLEFRNEYNDYIYKIMNNINTIDEAIKKAEYHGSIRELIDYNNEIGKSYK